MRSSSSTSAAVHSVHGSKKDFEHIQSKGRPLSSHSKSSEGKQLLKKLLALITCSICVSKSVDRGKWNEKVNGVLDVSVNVCCSCLRSPETFCAFIRKF